MSYDILINLLQIYITLFKRPNFFSDFDVFQGNRSKIFLFSFIFKENRIFAYYF